MAQARTTILAGPTIKSQNTCFLSSYNEFLPKKAIVKTAGKVKNTKNRMKRMTGKIDILISFCVRARLC